MPMTALKAALAFTLLTALPAAAQGFDPLGNSSSDASAGSETVTVGSADFPESQLLATIYAKALQAEGMTVETRLNIGSREVYIPALRDGSIDLLPEYTGALLSYLQPDTGAHAPDEVVEALREALPDGIAMLTPSDAQDADSLVVTKATAEEYDLAAISDLQPVAGELVLGAGPEFRTRREGLAGLEDVYGLDFQSMKTLDVGGPLTLSALLNGQVQVANLFSTNPAIVANDLVTLEDDKNLFAAQEIVPIIAGAKMSDEIRTVLDAVSAALTTEDLTVMNGRLADHESYDVVAGEWLAEHDLD